MNIKAVEEGPQKKEESEETPEIINVTNVYFTSENGVEDSTQFDTQDEGELAALWWDFCKENDLISLEKGQADYKSGVLLDGNHKDDMRS